MLANVKAEMARRDVTQAQLSVPMSMTQAQVSKRLRGLVPLTVPELLTVADFLRVPPADLVKASAA